MRVPTGRIVVGMAVVSVALFAVATLLKPVEVTADFGVVSRGEMRVTVGDEGQTRLRNLYVVNSPTSGRLLRVSFKAGDEVSVGDVLAVVQPSAAPFLNTRSLAEVEAKVEAAKALREQAQADLARAEAALEFARVSFRRERALKEKGVGSQKALDEAELNLKSRRAELEVAQKSVATREKEVHLAEASLTPAHSEAVDVSDLVEVKAPVSGRILKVVLESETVVTPGQAILELGDPAELEVVVDMLSEEAVKVVPGMKASIENWGGKTLDGVIRRVEPFGFKKVSALGIDEQRVNVIVDFVSPRREWQTLGHGYRVDVSVEVWAGTTVLALPVGALFRDGDGHAVYVVEDGRAMLRHVAIGHMNETHAEVISGLTEGEKVVLYPSDRIRAGTNVVDRSALP